MYDQLFSIGVKLAAAIFAMVASYLLTRVKVIIAKKLEKQEAEFLEGLIKEFCESAEQQLKIVDPDGSRRKKYVQEMLIKAGYEVTEIMKAKIEAAVYGINRRKNNELETTTIKE